MFFKNYRAHDKQLPFDELDALVIVFIKNFEGRWKHLKQHLCFYCCGCVGHSA